MLYVIYPAERLFDIYDGRAETDRLLSCTETSNTAATEQQKLARRSSKISPLNIGVCRRAWEQLTAGARGADDKRQSPAKQSQSQPQKSGVKPTLAETAGSWPKASSVLAIGGGDTQQAAQAPRTGAGKRTIMQNNRQLDEPQNPLKDLTHANHVDPLKQHNANAIKLVQIVGDFAKALGDEMEAHGQKVIALVDRFRGLGGETKNESAAMRRVYDSLLRQVEADATAHLELASVLQQQLARPTVECCFPRKVQNKWVFTNREGYENVLKTADEKLKQVQAEYKMSYNALLKRPEGVSESELKRSYLEAHNAYVMQLHAVNALSERFHAHCLPSLLNETAEVYEALCGLSCKCIMGISEEAGCRVADQTKRYQALSKEARAANAQSDLMILARNLQATGAQNRKQTHRRLFVPMSTPEQSNQTGVPALKDELVPTGDESLAVLEESLQIDIDALNKEIGQIQESIDSKMRLQRQSIESNLHTKAVEIQEQISVCRFELGTVQLHLAAVTAKKELFGGGNEAAQPDGMGNRKMSNGSTGSTKHKWLKAFKSLKTTPTTPPPNEKKQAMYHAVSTVVAMSKKNLDSESGSHQFREYTYRKITPCDACGQVLRGHARQGLRCRSCKANVHVDCANDLQPSQCPSLVPKRTAGLPLLRRQKSTAPPPDETPSNEQRWDLGGDYTSRSRAFGQPLVLSNDTSPSDFGSIAGSVSPTTSMFYTPQHQPRSLPTTPLQRTTSPSRKRGAAGSSATRPR